MVWIWHNSLPIDYSGKINKTKKTSMNLCHTVSWTLNHILCGKRRETGYIRCQSHLNQWPWNQVTTLESVELNCVKYLQCKIFLLGNMILSKQGRWKCYVMVAIYFFLSLFFFFLLSFAIILSIFTSNSTN